jgi:hypothetical protein
MHQLEAFASSCGLKISNPFIYEKYYPVNFSNFIVIDTNDTKYQAKNYDYWQEVVNLIIENLNKKDIKIIQLCEKNDTKLINAYSIIGCTFNQKAYLIKNSLLFIGSSNLGIQLASYYKKNIIALYGNVYSANVGPYWSTKNDSFLIEAFNQSEKPSFMPQEKDKVINKIKPDQIASNIFNFLNIKDNPKYKYLQIGANFNNRTIEVVPNMVANPQSLNVPHIIVRMDLYFNEEILEAQLKTGKCLIVTNKKISENIVNTYKENIAQVFYKIEQDNDPSFIKLLKNLNISYVLASYLEEDVINKIKINYMDFGLILKITSKSKLEIPECAKYYKSNHYILSNNKLYISEAAFEANSPIKDFNENIQEIIDTNTFWQYADNYAFLVDY